MLGFETTGLRPGADFCRFPALAGQDVGTAMGLGKTFFTEDLRSGVSLGLVRCQCQRLVWPPPPTAA